MSGKSYLQWMASETPTKWWHDSGSPDEIERALAHGAIGITTNPPLIAATIKTRPQVWKEAVASIPDNIKPEERAEAIMQKVVQNACKAVEHVFMETKGKQGFACGQVNPNKASYPDAMLANAKRIHEWAPNVSIKLPTTASGLEALEECAAMGYSVTSTLSFSVPQAVAAAESFKRGAERARKAGIKVGRCFAVIMIGRVDDYIRDVALDRKADVSESDIKQAGIEVVKRAYSIFRERNYEAVLMPAGLRGAYHVSEIAGADLTYSIHPKIQDMVFAADPEKAERVNIPIADGVIKRLKALAEFNKAYEPDGMDVKDFSAFGVVQRTLFQFIESGWAPMETFKY